MGDRKNNGEQVRTTTYNLLYVCTGNTCRSPMAEAITRHKVEERGWANVAVQSAGIAAAAGAPAARNAVAVAEERGLDLGGHLSQPLTNELVAWADLILVMGPAHLMTVVELGGREKVAHVTDFAGGETAGESIHDPFGGDRDVYQRTLDQLEQVVEGVLSRLEPILDP